MMKQEMKQKAALTEAFLRNELATCATQENLREIMEYAVMNGGKRLRPVLLLSAFELFDEKIEKALPFAAALEMIHCYSLVHDDLPAMDDDDLRRGKLTCHKKFSEFGAILAGDALLNLSFETMLKYADTFSASVSLKAMAYIAAASGAKGMCAGQMSDMEQSVTDFETLAKMYRGKTGALLKAALTAGGILGGAGEEECSILEQFADKIGLIFQIKDDVLDVTSDEQTLGKPVLSDEKNHKITFVSEYGIDKCLALMAEYEKDALADLVKLEKRLNRVGAANFLKELTVFMANRTN